LDRLPDRYRLPLLLCYLEGKTREEAAEALGVTPGTVKGQVRRGCELLRRRLARRGVTLSAGLFAAVAAPRIAAAAGRAAVLAAVLGAPSPGGAELAREVAMRIGVSRLIRGFLAGLLLWGVGIALIGRAAGHEPMAGRPLPVPSAPAAPGPEPRQ